MKYEEIANTKRFQEILEQIPAEERAKVEEAMREICENFEEKVLKPLETLVTKR